MKKGISLVGLHDSKAIEDVIQAFPDVYFELSYSIDGTFLDEIQPLVKGRVASIHSLCPRRDFFPNFACNDEHVLRWSENEMMKDIQTACRFGASIVVLHPGYIIPSLIPSETSERINLLKTVRKFIAIEEGAVCRSDYIRTPEYQAAFDIMVPNLVRLSRIFSASGLRLAIENLNPRAGYMLLHPDEIIYLAESTDLFFTLDIGHLWVSSELFGFDFIDAVKRIMATNRVLTTHLHSNPSDKRKSLFVDTHQSLDSFGMPYAECLEIIKTKGANMILETKECPLHNLSILFGS